jgi:hypothetical protein
MAFGYQRNSGIPRLNTYAEALARYEATKPINNKKRDKECRPLGHRRNTWYQIAKRESDGAIECIVYQRPIVTYRPDNVIELRNADYASVTYSHFVEDVAPSGVYGYVFDYAFVISLYGVEQRLEADEMLEIKLNAQNRYEYVNLKTQTTHAINRKALRETMDNHSEFLSYITNLTKLRGDEAHTNTELKKSIELDDRMTFDFRRMTWSTHQPTIDFAYQFKKWIANTDKNLAPDAIDGEAKYEGFYKAYLALVNSYGRYQWNRATNEDGYTLEPSNVIPSMRALILGMYRDKVLNATELPIGTIKRNRHRRYFTRGWKFFNNQYPD